MAKAKFPKQLQSETIHPITNKWLSEYTSETGLDLAKGYDAKLMNFLKFINFASKPFNEFTIEDVTDFVGQLIDLGYTESGINPYLSKVRQFRDFLIEKHPDTFGLGFLRDINDSYFYIDREKNNSDHFDLQTLNKVRAYIKSDTRWEYMFELILQLGIDKQDIVKCLPEKADLEKEVFIFNGGEISFKGTTIASLIRKYLQRENPKKISYSIYTDALRDVAKGLEEQKIYSKRITHQTYVNTHRAYWFTCPNCSRSFENAAANWVLAKIEDDSVFRLVCKDCKGGSQYES